MLYCYDVDMLRNHGGLQSQQSLSLPLTFVFTKHVVTVTVLVTVAMVTVIVETHGEGRWLLSVLDLSRHTINLIQCELILYQ